MKNIFLVRHGTSLGNIDKSAYYRYSDSDVPITDDGKVQAYDAGIQIVNLLGHFTANYEIFYSPYLRTRVTEKLIKNAIKKNSWGDIIIKETMMPLLIERKWGQLRDIVNSGEKTEDHFDFFFQPQNGESFFDTFQRVIMFDLWYDNHTVMDNTIIVGHGEWIKLYLMYKLEWSLDEFQKYKTPRNGQVFWLKDDKLAKETPLTIKTNI